MRTTVATLALLLAWPAGAAQAEDFYVDPMAGDPSGDGSASSPWRTLQEVVEAGLVETRHWASLPYEEGGTLETVNAGAPIGPGDTIYLRSGYHGEVAIEGAYNESTITIAAEPGHEPRLGSLLLRAASNWHVRGLSVSASYAETYDCGTLIDVDNHGWQGPSHDVVIEDCDVFSVDDVSSWDAADWVDMACNGISSDGERVELRRNRLRNVRFGISVSGADCRVAHNTVSGFSGDGMRGLGDGGVFEYNLVENAYDVDENHDDGFQSWSVGPDGVGSGEVRGIVLRGNVIVNYRDPEQPMRATLQGIGCFDGFFVDWVVENNVIITDHWHGITLLGARDSRIVNNTVIDLNETDPGPPWIQIGAHKDDTPSENVLVRNNLVTALNLPDDGSVTSDHNIVIEDLAAHFADPAAFDLHLLDSSAAVDSGSAEMAPARDADRVPRPQGEGYDIGAYEYHEGDVVIPDAGAGPDGGTAADGGTRRDGGTAADAGPGADAGDGPEVAGDGGCGCRTTTGAPAGGAGLALVVAAALLLRRRRAS